MKSTFYEFGTLFHCFNDRLLKDIAELQKDSVCVTGRCHIYILNVQQSTAASTRRGLNLDAGLESRCAPDTAAGTDGV